MTLEEDHITDDITTKQDIIGHEQYNYVCILNEWLLSNKMSKEMGLEIQ